MKPNRINLCQVVREALITAGYSTVKVVQAVNAELGKIALIEQSDKTSDGKISTSKGVEKYKVTVTGKFKYESKNTLPCTFDAWHSAIDRAEKIASMESLGIPAMFVPWLDGFAKATTETTAATTV